MTVGPRNNYIGQGKYLLFPRSVEEMSRMSSSSSSSPSHNSNNNDNDDNDDVELEEGVPVKLTMMRQTERARLSLCYPNPKKPCLLDRLAYRPDTFEYLAVGCSLRLEGICDALPLVSMVVKCSIANRQWTLLQSFFLYLLGSDVVIRRMFRRQISNEMPASVVDDYFHVLTINNYMLKSTPRDSKNIVSLVDDIFVGRMLKLWTSRNCQRIKWLASQSRNPQCTRTELYNHMYQQQQQQ